MKIKLTQRQWEALSHRLEVPDCIIENLGSESDGAGWFDPDSYQPQDLAAGIDALIEGWTGTVLDTRGADFISVDMTDAILSNCIEMSTWVASADSQDTDAGPESRKGVGARLTMVTLARIIEQGRGLDQLKVSDS